MNAVKSMLMDANDELFAESIRAFSNGTTQFTRGRYELALCDFRKSLDAYPQQKIVGAIFRHGQQLEDIENLPLLAADYFLLVTQHSQAPELKTQALDKITKILEAESIPNERKMIEAEKIFGLACQVYALSPEGFEGLLKKAPIVKILTTCMHDFKTDASVIGKPMMPFIPVIKQLVIAALARHGNALDVVAGIGTGYLERPAKKPDNGNDGTSNPAIN